jgi:hypothetical protein
VIRGTRGTTGLPLARAVADALRVLLLVATLLTLVFGTLEAAITLGLVAVTALAVRLAQARPGVDLAFVALAGADAALNAAGAFTTFNRSDMAGHFILPALVAPILWAAVERAGVTVAPGRRWPAVVVAAACTIALGATWELVEWASDALFATNLSLGYRDTLQDIATDIAGAFVGAALLVRPARRTGTRDVGVRTPGHEVYTATAGAPAR